MKDFLWFPQISQICADRIPVFFTVAFPKRGRLQAKNHELKELVDTFFSFSS
jgi:hypothetical protein